MESSLKLKHYIAFDVKDLDGNYFQYSFFSTEDMGKQIHMQFMHYPIFIGTKILNTV